MYRISSASSGAVKRSIQPGAAIELPGAQSDADRGGVLVGMLLAEPGFLQAQRVLSQAARDLELLLGGKPSEHAELLRIGDVACVGHVGGSLAQPTLFEAVAGPWSRHSPVRDTPPCSSRVFAIAPRKMKID